MWPAMSSNLYSLEHSENKKYFNLGRLDSAAIKRSPSGVSNSTWTIEHLLWCTLSLCYHQRSSSQLNSTQHSTQLNNTQLNSAHQHVNICCGVVTVVPSAPTSVPFCECVIGEETETFIFIQSISNLWKTLGCSWNNKLCTHFQLPLVFLIA